MEGYRMEGIVLDLALSKHELVMSSLHDYYDHCSKGKKPIIHLVIKRLNENKKPLDGMYLRTIEEALEHSKTGHKLQNDIKTLREQFQFSSMSRLFSEIS
jgi:hypothetical protein